MIVRDGPKRPRYPLALIHPLGPLFRHLPLSLRRHLLYLRTYGRWGNFRAPRLITEKTQWRIINDKRPLLTFVEDKLASTEYARNARTTAGMPEEIQFPETYWVGSDVRELQAIAHKLPARWVLKPNHSCGRVILIDSSAEPVNWEALAAISGRWLERDEEEVVMGHWAYSQARYLLVAEERVGNSAHAPDDFKIVCFDGTPGYDLWVNREAAPTRFAFFRPDGTRIPWGAPTDVSYNDHADETIFPVQLRERMLRSASVIAAPFDWIRVDFYVDGETLWFGELTAYAGGGMYVIDQVNNEHFGALWQLPDLNALDPREAEWRALLQGIPKGTLQA